MKLLVMWEINKFSDGILPSLICIAIVFIILALIALLLSLINKVKALDVKEPVYLKDGTKVDDDMMAAILVACIDYRNEIKEDVKVISAKKVN